MPQQLDTRDRFNAKLNRPLRRRSLAAVALLTAACAADVGPESASDSQLGDETKAVEQSLTPYVQTLFQDTFTRSNSSTLGNGWSELEASNALVRVYGSKLHFYDTSDVTNRPMAQRTFPWVAHGELVWEFDADWRRTGTDSDYTVFMQLGEGSKLNSSNQNTGVGVNLVWAKIGTSQQKLGYRNNGATTALTTMSAAAHIKVTANLDSKTYSVAMNGITVGSGLPFDADTLTRLDTIRLFTTKLNETSFAGRTFDNVSIKLSGARFSTLVGIDQRVCQELASELGAQCENQGALAARVAALFEANNHIYNDPGIFGQGIYFNPDSIYSFVGDADAERWADFSGFDVKVVFTVADPVSNCVWWENKVLMNGRTAELVLTDQFVLAHELAHTLRMYDYHTNRHWQYQPPQTMMVGGVVPFPYWEPNSKYVIDAYVRSTDRPNFPGACSRQPTFRTKSRWWSATQTEHLGRTSLSASTAPPTAGTRCGIRSSPELPTLKANSCCPSTPTPTRPTPAGFAMTSCWRTCGYRRPADRRWARPPCPWPMRSSASSRAELMS